MTTLATPRRQRRSQTPEQPASSGTVQLLDASRIRPGSNDRTVFNAEKLAELAASIKHNGLAQPITVRPMPDGGWQIVAGERRYRAMTEVLGEAQVPCLVRDLTDSEAAAIMLAENAARLDLNPIEEARAYAHRSAEFGWSDEEVADMAGVSKDRVKRRKQLLRLIPEVQQLVSTGNLSIGHAEALTRLDSNRQISALRILQSSTHPLTVKAFQGICEQLYGEQQQDGLFKLEAFWTETVQQGSPLPRTGKHAVTGAPTREDVPAVVPSQRDSVGAVMDRFIAELLAAGQAAEAGAVGTLYSALVQGNWVSVPANAKLLEEKE